MIKPGYNTINVHKTIINYIFNQRIPPFMTGYYMERSTITSTGE